jgi:hypothetical protein
MLPTGVNMRVRAHYLWIAILSVNMRVRAHYLWIAILSADTS